jgi:hypothetical protein
MVLGSTIVLDLTIPAVQAWLQPQIDASWQQYYATFTPGDANTDGAVDSADLLTLAQNYGLATDACWPGGDFNSDAAVDFADLLALAQNYTAGPGVSAGAPADQQADWALARSIVPEPTMLGAVGVMMALAVRRRSR